MEKEQKSVSPTPQKEEIVKEAKVLMTFPGAMVEIIAGNKVSRFEWEDDKTYGFLNGEFLSLHKEDGKNYQWIVSDGDLKAEDWFII